MTCQHCGGPNARSVRLLFVRGASCQQLGTADLCLVCFSALGARIEAAADPILNSQGGEKAAGETTALPRLDTEE